MQCNYPPQFGGGSNLRGPTIIKMNIVLLGPPGSGKGTQAKKLAENLSLPHISTGDIFRENMKNKTELGLQVKEIINAGNLVSDELTNQLMQNRVAEPDCANGYILDGYPRNLVQAEFWDNVAKIDKAINVQVSDVEVLNRLSARRSCPACKKIYNLDFNPPVVEGKCECGADLVLRDDDKPEVIAERLRIYHELTEPVIEFYRNNGILVDINGASGIDSVLAEILEKIKSSSANQPL